MSPRLFAGAAALFGLLVLAALSPGQGTVPLPTRPVPGTPRQGTTPQTTPLPDRPRPGTPTQGTPTPRTPPRGTPAPSTTRPAGPKLEPVAETKLIMEGLAHANFRGLERLLTQKPADAQAWTFARGQALLIAETGNLLMLRPPKNEGQQLWFDRATELRQKAVQLGQTVSQRDFERARTGLVEVANSCNRCHQTFRVDVEIAPFLPAAPAPKAE